MLNKAILLGQSLAEVRSIAGQELEQGTDEGKVILRYSGYSDAASDYVYLKDDKVVLLSFTRVTDLNATVETLFPDFPLPEKSYLFHNPSRETNPSYTLAVWSKRGVAVVVDGFKSTDHVLRTLIFVPGNESNLTSVWNQSQYIGKEKPFVGVNVQVTPATVELATPPITSSAPTHYSSLQLGVPGGVIVMLLCIGILLLLKKKRSARRGLKENESEVNSSADDTPPPSALHS
jgi:hypothetical protein